MQLIKLHSEEFCLHTGDRSPVLVTLRNAYVEKKPDCFISETFWICLLDSAVNSVLIIYVQTENFVLEGSKRTVLMCRFPVRYGVYLFNSCSSV